VGQREEEALERVLARIAEYQAAEKAKAQMVEAQEHSSYK
jgi:hypothetical protein